MAKFEFLKRIEVIEGFKRILTDVSTNLELDDLRVDPRNVINLDAMEFNSISNIISNIELITEINIHCFFPHW